MGRPQGWAAERTGRAPMRSPGRPGVNQRETKQAFWKCITDGLPIAKSRTYSYNCRTPERRPAVLSALGHEEK